MYQTAKWSFWGWEDRHDLEVISDLVDEFRAPLEQSSGTITRAEASTPRGSRYPNIGEYYTMYVGF